MDVALQKYHWHDVRDQVTKVNAELAKLLDDVDPPADCYFYLAEYCYGDSILEKGRFHVPSPDGSVVPLDAAEVSQSLKEDLLYNLGTNPPQILLEGAQELFVSLDNRIIPFNVVRPGAVFGLSRLLDTPLGTKASHTAASIWDFTAGARSVVMLPRINEVNRHKKLEKEFRFEADTPKTLYDHWNVLKSIGKHAPWRCRVLYFSRNWFKYLHDSAWAKLKVYFLDSNRRLNAFWRNSFAWNITISQIHKNRHIKTPLYVSEIVKGILCSAASALPCFRPQNDDIVMPTGYIQDAYVNTYQLKDQMPVIMGPDYFGQASSVRPAYFTLQFPITEGVIDTYKTSSAIADLEEIIRVLRKHIKEIKCGALNVQTTFLHDVVKNTAFDFFHTSANDYDDIKNAIMLKNESDFLIDRYPDNKLFPDNARFFKSVIQITQTNDL